ncbi:MAG: ABC transporter ATP-binding protein [Candidatus Lokiarchaeota archaeon]
MIEINSPSNIALAFKDFSFIYGSDRTGKNALKNLSFNLEEGETLVLAGPSGSGKSTLTYAMSGIIPWRLKGFMKGDVLIFGKNSWDYDFIELSKTVGVVKQNPLDQLTTFKVKDEIAFGLENLEYPMEEIEQRIEDISKMMGIYHLLNRDTDQLSGGQKQLVILSSFLALRPKILILDEPIAFLDRDSESLLLSRLKTLKKSSQYPITIIIVEHRLSRVMNIADKILVLNESGEVALNGGIKELFTSQFNELKNCNLRVPWIFNISNEFNHKINLTNSLPNPFNFNQFLDFIPRLNEKELLDLRKIIIDNEINPKAIEKYEVYGEKIKFENLYIESYKQTKEEKLTFKENFPNNNDDTILETRELTFKYPNSGIIAINNLSIKINKGDFIGLVGPNGSGKTTLLYLLANLYNPTSGEIFYKDQNIRTLNSYEYAQKIGFIFQNPETMIFNPTIKDEILYGPKNFGIINEIEDDYLNKLIELIGKEDLEKNPYKLSWGQKRRLNLSSVFIYNPEIILLDEPFIGQDQRTIDALIQTLFIENKRGKTIIISSHDYHMLLKYTKRIMELNRDGSLRDYEAKNNYFRRYSSLGPIVLLKNVEQRLKEVSN